MKILALSDQIVDFIYSPMVRERFPDIDLIVGCGDLPGRYLEYVVTQFNVPLVYVPGNHDIDNLRVPGGESIDGKLLRVRGLTVAGLGGSQRYKADGRHQYTEAEASLRVARLAARLMAQRAARRRLDLFVTHAPVRGIHDAPDLPHIGFAAYRELLRLFRPRLMLHGHTHSTPNLQVTETTCESTRIVNVFPYRVIDLAESG